MDDGIPPHAHDVRGAVDPCAAGRGCVHSGMLGSPPRSEPLHALYGPPVPSSTSADPAAPPSAWWLVLALVGTAVLVAPTLGYGLGYDHGMVYYQARTILRGHWPYADSFDTAFPGGPLLTAISIAIAGNNVLAFRIEDVLIQIATGGLLYAAGRRLAGPLAGVYAACGYAALYVTGGFYHTGQRDGFMVPLILVALVALWAYWANPARRGLVWLSGLSLGLACTIRPTYALLGVAGAVALLLERGPSPTTAREDRTRAIRAAAGFAGMAALPLLVVILVYVVTGHARAFGELLTFLLTVYPSLERMTRATVLLRFVTFARKTIWIGVVLSAFSPAWRTRRVEMRSLAGLLACLVLVRLWESKGWQYQYWPPFACLALLAGVGWVWLGERAAGLLRVTGRRAVVVTAAIVAVALVLEVGRTGASRYRGLAAAVRVTASDTSFVALVGSDPKQAALARYLKDHTQPTDSIQLWGAETMVLVAADRWSATRFTDPGALFCQSGPGQRLSTTCGGNWPRPAQVAMRNEIVTSLTTHPPRYIVAHYANGTLAFEEGADAAPDLPQLRTLLDRSYQPEATFGNWTAYVRRDPSTPQ